MTQVFDAQGVVHPATILRVTPLTVTQVKTEETDGYEAVQVATGAQKPERVAKANRTKGSAVISSRFTLYGTIRESPRLPRRSVYVQAGAGIYLTRGASLRSRRTLADARR